MTLASGYAIKFNDVFVNAGDGYNNHTGVFTCPQPGLYQFSWHLLKKSAGNLNINLSVNGKTKLTSNVPGATSWESNTGIVVLPLKRGDMVCLKPGHSGRKIHGSSGFSTFNGILL